MSPRRLRGVRRSRGDRGAVLIEFAFVFPILAMLFVGMMDIGLVELGRSVASSAARDGARVGMINFVDADQNGSTNNAAVKDAVNGRLVGLVDQATLRVDVACLDDTTLNTIDCDPDVIELGRDLIQVTVHWSGIAASPFLSNNEHTDTARMTIIGAPDGTSTPVTVDCTITSVSVSPNPVSIDATGALLQDLTVTATLSGSACGVVTATIAGEPTSLTPPQSGSPVTFLWPQQNGTGWVTGRHVVTISAAAGAALSSSQALIVNLDDSGSTTTTTSSTTTTTVPGSTTTVPGSTTTTSTTTTTTTTTVPTSTTSACLITSLTASTPTNINGAGKMSQNVTISVTTSGGCGSAPTYTVSPAPSPYDNSQVMSGGPTSWTATIAKLSSVWTAGGVTVTVTTSTGVTQSIVIVLS